MREKIGKEEGKEEAMALWWRGGWRISRMKARREMERLGFTEVHIKQLRRKKKEKD